MNKEEILKKAITKAKFFKEGVKFSVFKQDYRYYVEIEGGESQIPYGVEYVIFSYRFAKAFWGEEYVDYEDGLTESQYKKAIENLSEYWRHDIRKWGVNGKQIAWQYHLQQMVIANDPIEYLRQFIDEKSD